MQSMVMRYHIKFLKLYEFFSSFAIPKGIIIFLLVGIRELH